MGYQRCTERYIYPTHAPKWQENWPYKAGGGALGKIYDTWLKSKILGYKQSEPNSKNKSIQKFVLCPINSSYYEILRSEK